MSKKTIKVASLPMGFAEQVMELEIRLEEEESLELIQILSQMYKVDVL
jgi:ribonucleotide reductase alpha subunit